MLHMRTARWGRLAPHMPDAHCNIRCFLPKGRAARARQVLAEALAAVRRPNGSPGGLCRNPPGCPTNGSNCADVREQGMVATMTTLPPGRWTVPPQ